MQMQLGGGEKLAISRRPGEFLPAWAEVCVGRTALRRLAGGSLKPAVGLFPEAHVLTQLGGVR